jgi:PAS domain S-box-containing protein
MSKITAAAMKAHEETAALVHRLRETQQRLQEIHGRELDAVLHPNGEQYLLLDAQEKLQRSEEAQRDLAVTRSSILNALPANIALIDHDGVILSVNDGWRRFAAAGGFEGPGVGLGLNYLDVCDAAIGECAEDAYRVAAGVRSVLDGDMPLFALEYPCHSPTQRHWYRLMVSSMVNGAVVMHIDITERKLAEEALRESEERFRGMFEAAAAGIATSTRGGRYLQTNAAYCQMLGYTAEELRTMDFASVTHPDDLALNLHLRDELLAGQRESFIMEKRYITKGGEIIWVRHSVSSTHGPGGEINTLVVIAEDITWRKRTEARFRRLVDSDVQGVFFWNRNGKVTDANNYFLRLTGYTREDLEAGRIEWTKITPLEYVPHDENALKEIDAAGTCAPYEKQYIRADGSTVFVLIGAAIFEDNPEEGVCFVLDLTERKEIEKQFLRAQRVESIGILAGGIAHDLNNCLTPILTALELLDLQFPDSKSQKLLEVLGASARRGAQIVRQILLFARGGAEGQRLPVNIKQILRDLKNIVDDTFLRQIQVRVNVADDIWTVVGDATQLHQVLLNLCVNARDAMPGGGRLTISAENLELDAHYVGMEPEARPGLYVVLHVQDEGTGIPPDVIKKIFDPFFTTKEVGKGTGLGLSSALGIVKSHGGFIRVYSEPGIGTVFKVYLPAPAAGPSQEGPRPAPKLPRGNGELILVVDDEPAVRQVTKTTLEAFGYRVVVASDGAEGITEYAARPGEFAAVITDMMMPVVDGATFMRVLRHTNPRVRVIASSGHFPEGRVHEAGGLENALFLPKPYSAEVLLNTLKEALGRKDEG